MKACDMMTLEDYLAQDARCYPEKTAVICGNERLTYAQSLVERSLPSAVHRRYSSL